METIKDFGQTTPQLVFSYDHQDRVTWITYLNNGEVCYEYDPDGRITRVGRVLPGNNASVCSSANEKTDYVYDGKGRLKTITYPNGVQSFTEYDGNTGLIKVAGNRSATGALLYSDTFAYYPNSHLYQSITRKTPTGSETTQYTYDAYERLLTVTEADGRKTAYEYDAFGNRTKETVTNINDAGATGGSPKAYGIYVYEYPAGSNRLSRILFNGQPQETFTYDNAGRITQRVHSTAGTTTYGYDDRGLLATVTKSGTTISYTYDALGVRKSKTVNGTRTNYLTAPLFGMSRVLAELNTNQTVKATYVYGGSQQIKEEPAIADRGKDLYLVRDGIVGNITHAIDMTGSLRNQYKYDAFGVRTQVSAATTGSYKHYGYTGEEYDEETGLVYLRARYYDPTLGRFISADPFWGRLEEPASQNRYVYVQNNPLLYTDPRGLDSYSVTSSYILGGGGTSTLTLDTSNWSVFYTQGIGAGFDVGVSGSWSPDKTTEGQNVVISGSYGLVGGELDFDTKQYQQTGKMDWAPSASVGPSESLLPTRYGVSATYQVTTEVINLQSASNWLNEQERSLDQFLRSCQ